MTIFTECLVSLLRTPVIKHFSGCLITLENLFRLSPTRDPALLVSLVLVTNQAVSLLLSPRTSGWLFRNTCSSHTSSHAPGLAGFHWLSRSQLGQQLLSVIPWATSAERACCMLISQQIKLQVGVQPGSTTAEPPEGHRE